MKGIIVGCVGGCQDKLDVNPIEITNFAPLDKNVILKILKIKQIFNI